MPRHKKGKRDSSEKRPHASLIPVIVLSLISLSLKLPNTSICEAAEKHTLQNTHPELKQPLPISVNHQPSTAKHSPSPKAYAAFCKGLTHEFKGDFKSAVKEFLKANDYYSQSPTIHLHLAICYKRLNQKDEMLTHLKILSKLKPNDSELHLKLAESLRYNRIYEDAIEEYEKVWNCGYEKTVNSDKLFRVLVKPYLYIAEAYQQENKPLEAISVYKKLLKHVANIDLPEMGAKSMRIQLQIGQLYDEAGEIEKAIECYNSLLRDINELNNPADSGIKRDILRLRIAQLYAKSGREKKAIECYIALLKGIEKLNNSTDSNIEPDALRLELGLLYEKTEQIQKALDCYRNIISRSSDNRKSSKTTPQNKKVRVIAYLSISFIHAGKKNYAEAVKILQHALNENLSDPRIYRFLGEFLRRNKKYDEALAILKQGISYFPNDRDIYFTLASLYDDRDMDSEAERALKKTLEIDPGFPDANNYLGYFYAEKGINLDKAVELVNRALKKEPSNGAYLDSLGWAYYKQALLIDKSAPEARKKKMTLALEKLKEAVKQMNDPVIREHLGDVYYTMGKIKQAKSEWEKALSLWNDEKNSEIPPGPEGVKKKLENLKKVESRKRGK